MKKTRSLSSGISFLLLLAVLMAFVPAPRAYASDMAGECGKDGDNLTWTYSGGVLTITGEGEMADYEEKEDIPWYDIRDDIERVELPEGLESIGDRAFSGCYDLTSMELPESLTGIGDYAFDFCSSLTAIELPESLTDVGANPFVNGERLTSIAVAEEHPYLEIIDGALFSKPDSRLICLPQGLYTETYSVPAGTLSIGDRAFWGCGRLETVELPDGLRSIGDYAFGECDDIRSIELPDSLTQVGANPFYFCDDLTSLVVSGDHPYLEVVDEVLFSKPDRRLVCFPCGSDRKTCSVPAGTQSISAGAFGGCDRLTSVELPDGLNSIGENTFYRCYDLVSLTIPEGVTSIGKSAFFNCVGLSDVEFPASLTAIGDMAFGSCERLTSISLPEGLESIGDKAFARCKRLSSVRIPDSVTSVGDGAFEGCWDNSVESADGSVPGPEFTVGQGSCAERYCVENGLKYRYS